MRLVDKVDLCEVNKRELSHKMCDTYFDLLLICALARVQRLFGFREFGLGFLDLLEHEHAPFVSNQHTTYSRTKGTEFLHLRLVNILIFMGLLLLAAGEGSEARHKKQAV